MTSHRTISLTLTLAAVLMAVAPSSAFAGSLLSGYGGPGEGNQAILGSALVGGGGGAGGGGGSSRLIGGSSSTAAAGVGAQAGSRGRGSRTRGGGKRPAGGAAGSRGGSGEASGGAARAYPVVSPGSSTSQLPSGASETLGLSGGDLGYVLLALGALAAIGVVTRRLARASRTRAEGL